MTFYEAALRVLETAGRPLSFQEITEKSIQANLLSHIGKTPELTMLSRLLAMARRKTDRKVVVTAKDTFALADWALPEAPDALNDTLKSEVREEDNLPALRPAERHPEPRVENVRVSGRGAERKHRRDDDGKRRKKKFPPLPEVAFEILSDAGTALRPAALVERAKERELAGDEVSEQRLLTAMLEDNQRRIDAGRRPQFVFDQASGEVALERAGAATEAPPVELQAAFAAALGIPMEGGRPVLPRAQVLATAVSSEEMVTAQAVLKTAAKDLRRATARALRKRLQEIEPGTFEKSVVKVLHALGYRELKVARRSKEGSLMTARKRDGSLELRWVIRIVKGQGAVDRKLVQEARRDVGHQSAQLALLVAVGDVRADAKAEATSGGSVVFLWTGEGLADKFLEAEAGVKVTRVETYELDDHFFETARADAEEAAKRREERKSERQSSDGGRGEQRELRTSPSSSGIEPGGDEGEEAASLGERSGDPAPQSARPPRPPREEVRAVTPDLGAEGDEGDDEDGEEGDDDLEDAEAYVAGAARPEGAPGAAGPGAPGEKRRRRRRRRGRRGRGPKPEGTAGAPGGPGAPADASAPPSGGEGASAEPAQVAAPPPPPPPPPSAGGEGNAG